MDKNKDPAFLFYSSDFLTGTMFMSNEQVGKYIRLMCAQHQIGHLKEKDMLRVCGSYDEEIFSKFSQDSEGLYFNKRLEMETEKRSNYARSRSENRKKANNKETCVYLIKNLANGLVKIGSSNKPERRLIELKNQLGNEDLYIVAVVENVEQKLESELHKQYEKYCSYNEWFKLTGEQIEEIITTNHMNNHMMKHMYKHMENENENENKDININKNESKNEVVKHKYGLYKNVLLSDKDYEKLTTEFPSDYIDRIERLSEYMASKGTKYKSHLATIRSWAKKDKPKSQKVSFMDIDF